ncbi:hypothetical protein ACMFMG_011455 [Clarireedia jacksonii]
MRGVLKTCLWVVVAAVGTAQGYTYEPRGLSDILGALEAAAGKEHGGQPQTTTTTTITKPAAASTAAALGTGAALGTTNVQTVTVTVAGLNMTQTQTVTEQVTQMVTQVITQMATQIVTSMVTVTMMQTTTMMVPASAVTSTSTSLTLAAIQGGKQPASVSSQAAQPVATTLSSKESSIELTLGGGVAASTPPTAQAGTKSLSTSVLSSVTAAAMQLGAAAVAQPTPQAVDINSFSLRSSLMLGNLAVATSAIQ